MNCCNGPTTGGSIFGGEAEGYLGGDGFFGGDGFLGGSIFGGNGIIGGAIASLKGLGQAVSSNQKAINVLSGAFSIFIIIVMIFLLLPYVSPKTHRKLARSNTIVGDMANWVNKQKIENVFALLALYVVSHELMIWKHWKN